MANVIVDIFDPPRFQVGDRVRAKCLIRNDGTYAGRRTGDVLIAAGEPGYIQSIGDYLQRYRIYDVDFFNCGMIIGMRAHELDEGWDP